MSTRPFNFSAGPATLPAEVLAQAASEMLDWRGSGMSVMEMSHRGAEYTEIHQTALADLRELLALPDNYRILFTQGGALAENALVPLNLLRGHPRADYLVSGSWSAKSFKEASRYCEAHLVASGEADGFKRLPPRDSWQLSKDAAYVHICTNETVNGLEFFDAPDVGDVPLVADVSSHFLSRPMDVSRYGVLYGGAQKNVGMAGLTVLVVREDLLERALPVCPSAFEWRLIEQNDSMYNTPPTYAIYIAGLVFQWLKRQGGLPAIEQRNRAKAELLYGALDDSEFYYNDVDPAARSRMNVPFRLRDESLNEAFLKGAKERGLLQLKGHKSVGGMRASIYNAMPLAGVQALVEYLQAFAQRHG